VAPLASEAEWEAAARALTAAFAANRSGTLEDLRTFIDRQLSRYRAMQAAGFGQWFGEFVEGELAGSLGVVRHGELGRFQLVGTDPRFGRRAADASYHAAKGVRDGRVREGRAPRRARAEAGESLIA
jgi:hypothetical protein